MDAVKFAHDRNRMCNAERGQGEGCKSCPLDQIMDRNNVCSVWCFQNPEKAIEAVEKWAAEHPVKTRQSEFLKQWPETRIDKTTGVLTICPAELTKEYRDDRGACGAYSVETCVCEPCRREFWLAEAEE